MAQHLRVGRVGKTGIIGGICDKDATNFLAAGRGLIVWDQPFRFLHGLTQNALLWEVAPSFQIRVGRAVEDLRLMEKGGLLAKKPLVTDTPPNMRDFCRASPNCATGLVNMLRSP